MKNWIDCGGRYQTELAYELRRWKANGTSSKVMKCDIRLYCIPRFITAPQFISCFFFFFFCLMLRKPFETIQCRWISKHLVEIENAKNYSENLFGKYWFSASKKKTNEQQFLMNSQFKVMIIELKLIFFCREAFSRQFLLWFFF